MIAGTTEINEKKTHIASVWSQVHKMPTKTSCGLHLSEETFKATDFTEITVQKYRLKFILIELIFTSWRTPYKNYDESIAKLEFHVKYFHTLKRLQCKSLSKLAKQCNGYLTKTLTIMLKELQWSRWTIQYDQNSSQNI